MRLLFLIRAILFVSLSFNVQAEQFTFAVADDEPPFSSKSGNEAIGIIPDIIKLVFSHLPAHQVEIKPYPWTRAQHEVERGNADGLLTYPSTKRKKYASFTTGTVFELDFGYLVYDRNNPRRQIIESATSFQDLKDFKIITQAGAEWESDNIPEYMQKIEANQLQTMLHLLVVRKEGDFFIMHPELAIYLAKNSGYEQNINYRAVDFINDSLIPLHIGIRRSHPDVNEVISEIDAALSSEKFRKQFDDMLESYR